MPTVLITGGHGGIGLECSRHLAGEYRANLVLAGRSLERMDTVARDLAKTYGVRVDTLTPDTSSLASYDERAASKMWNDSKALVGLKPDEEAVLLR